MTRSAISLLARYAVLFVGLFLLSALTSLGQSGEQYVVIDSQWEYRIAILGVEDPASAKESAEPIRALFQTCPRYHEEQGQYVFTSRVFVSEQQFETLAAAEGYEVLSWSRQLADGGLIPAGTN